MTLAQRSGVPLDWHGLAVCMAPRLPSLPSAIDQLVLTKHYTLPLPTLEWNPVEAWKTVHGPVYTLSSRIQSTTCFAIAWLEMTEQSLQRALSSQHVDTERILNRC